MQKWILSLAAAALLWPTSAHAHIPEGCRQAFTQMKLAVRAAKHDHESAAEAGRALSGLFPIHVRMALMKGEPIPANWKRPDPDELLRALERAASALSGMKRGTEGMLLFNAKLLKCVAGLK